MSIRIGRFLSQTGLCSRRNTAIFLREHQIFFLGRQISELNFKIEDDQLSLPVCIDGKNYYWKSEQEVILLNKPLGYVCSHKEFKGEKSIMNFLDSSKKKYFFAGRLDKTSRGLIIFSNDGQLIYELTHPSFRVEKVYHIHVSPPLEGHLIKKTLKGVYDRQDLLKFDNLKLLKNQGHYEVSLHQGKNREIRRIMRTIRRNVIDLKRIRIGNFELKNLKEGQIELLK